MALSSSVLHFRSPASKWVRRGSSPISCYLATRSHPLTTGKTQPHSHQTQCCPRLHLWETERGNPSKGTRSSPNAARVRLAASPGQHKGDELWRKISLWKYFKISTYLQFSFMHSAGETAVEQTALWKTTSEQQTNLIKQQCSYKTSN